MFWETEDFFFWKMACNDHVSWLFFSSFPPGGRLRQRVRAQHQLDKPATPRIDERLQEEPRRPLDPQHPRRRRLGHGERARPDAQEKAASEPDDFLRRAARGIGEVLSTYSVSRCLHEGGACSEVSSSFLP